MSEVATVWVPQIPQEGEYASSGSLNIDTEAGLDIVLEDGTTNIILEDNTFTSIPATVYTSDPGQ